MTLYHLYDILEKKLSQEDCAVLKKDCHWSIDILLKSMLVCEKSSAIPLPQTITLITSSITMSELCML